jgi:NADPH:quinone reductase
VSDTRSVVASAYGGPEVLQVVRTALREPGPGEIVLEVRAAGVNPIDWKRYSGARGTDPTLLPMPLGLEAAGVVVAVGVNAEGPAGPVKVGDSVMAYPITGAYADRVVIPAASAVPLAAGVPWEPAGGLLLAGATAVHALRTVSVTEGDVVLVHGASGAVGRLATELAVRRGARVIGTANTAHHEALRQLGATPVTYGDGLEARVRELATDGVDAAIDTVGSDEAVDVSVALVADRERIVTVVVGPRAVAAGIRLIGGAPGAEPGTEVRRAARLELAELIGKGALMLPVRGFALEDAAEAHRLSREGHPGAKLILVP